MEPACGKCKGKGKLPKKHSFPCTNCAATKGKCPNCTSSDGRAPTPGDGVEIVPCDACSGEGTCRTCLGQFRKNEGRPVDRVACTTCSATGRSVERCGMCDYGAASTEGLTVGFTVGLQFNPQENILPESATNDGGQWHGWVEMEGMRWPQDIAGMYLIRGRLRAAGRDGNGAFQLTGTFDSSTGEVEFSKKCHATSLAGEGSRMERVTMKGTFSHIEGVRTLGGGVWEDGKEAGKFLLYNGRECGVQGDDCVGVAQYREGISGLLACTSCAKCEGCLGMGTRELTCGICSGTGVADAFAVCEACQAGKCGKCKGGRTLTREALVRLCKGCGGKGRCGVCKGYRYATTWLETEECPSCRGGGSALGDLSLCQASIDQLLPQKDDCDGSGSAGQRWIEARELFPSANSVLGPVGAQWATDLAAVLAPHPLPAISITCSTKSRGSSAWQLAQARGEALVAAICHIGYPSGAVPSGRFKLTHVGGAERTSFSIRASLPD